MIKVMRVYDEIRPEGSKVYLVDRLWPRGVKKENIPLDSWLKNVAPSTGLRKWFGHDPEKWDEFRRRYFEELDEHPENWSFLFDEAHNGSVILLYAAKDELHNNAVALKEYLENKQDAPS